MLILEEKSHIKQFIIYKKSKLSFYNVLKSEELKPRNPDI